MRPIAVIRFALSRQGSPGCRPWLWILAIVLGLSCPAAGASRPVTIEAMLRMASPQDVTVSADGRRLAFTVLGVSGAPGAAETTSRIYLTTTSSSGSNPLTSAREQCEKPHFSPDGTRLAYLVAGEDQTAVVVLCLATGQRRILYRRRGDVLDLAWAPDGKNLAVTLSPLAGPDGKRSDAGEADVEVLSGELGVSTGLYLLASEGHGQPRPLVTDREVGDFVFSPDGTRIAFETISPNTPVRGRRHVSRSGALRPEDAAQADIAIVDLATRAVTLLAATDASETNPRFSPDGRRLAYVSTAAPGFYFNAARVMVLPVTGGTPRPLAATPDARPELLGWSTTGDCLYVREASGTGAVLWTLPADGSPLRPFSKTSLMVAQATLSAKGNAVGLVLEDCDTPAEVWSSPTEHFAPQQRSSLNKDAAGLQLPKTELVHWTSPDGTRIEGLYTHPVHAPAGPPPLLVEVHGGPALATDRQYIAALNYYPLAIFAERGYAIFRPNVRGSDGYGTAFRLADRNDWGGRDFEDLESGIDALVDRGWADPHRLGIMGWSYGGYLTAWAIGHTDRFKAASVGAGITDLVSQAGSMDLPDFIPLYFGGEAYERFEMLFDRSPLKYAAAITTPTLFQHGVADDRVPFTQSMELFTALSRRGVPTSLAAYPRSGHDVTEPELVRDLMTRNLDWFARFLPPSTSDGRRRAGI